jgi:phenylalanine-4-hydroxylase
VLEQFADTMAFRRGGVYGLQKAVDSRNTCTAVYSSGLQVSGTFTGFKDDNGDVAFIKTTGPTALSADNRQLKGHGKNYHKDGFSSPVGKLKGYSKPLEDFTGDDLAAAEINIGKQAKLQFENGILVIGEVNNILQKSGKIQLITLKNCKVTNKGNKVLFDPSWGVYDMAVGEKITSVFCGAADKDAFLEIAYKSDTGTHHPQHDYKTLELHKLYQQVRNRRHTGGDLGFLGNVWLMLQRYHYDDWLCALEILELLDHENAEPALAQEIRKFLENKAANQPGIQKADKRRPVPDKPPGRGEVDSLI